MGALFDKIYNRVFPKDLVDQWLEETDPEKSAELKKQITRG
jgi:hypothetical protein